ncbi:MAG TPA: asparagine synthase-related protein [Candidatus Xenobia bacterium]|nr:asparagine synthase-related protein [Candidatus Xenobia bacterium]
MAGVVSGGRRRLEAIHQALAHCGTQEWVIPDEPAGMALRAWNGIAASPPQRWDRFRVVADAALYNRGELERALGDCPSGTSVAELIARCFARWGADCVHRLDGDFAFAVWDEARRELFCARDPLGIRPFFYRWDGKSLAWASEVKGLAADPDYSPAPDEATVGEFLLGWSRFPDVGATFYRGIQQLPGGHRMTLADGRLRVERYWDIEPASAAERPFQESLEEFRALFAAAVQKRLAGAGRAGLLISGGLDSTAIGSWVEHWGQSRAALDYVSYVVLDARGDERRYLRDFEEKYSCAVQCLEFEQTRILEGIESGTDVKENPFLDTAWDIARRWSGHLGQQRCRVVLTGLGGDNIFPAPGPAFFLDTCRRHGWHAAWRSYQRTCSYFEVPRGTFLGPTLRLLLPAGLRRQAKRWLGREVPAWIEPAFARRSGLLERVRQPLPRRGFSTCTQEEDYLELTSGRLALMLGYYNRLGAAHGFEFRHPFFDPALVRFTVLSPLEYKIRDGETKVLLRQGLAGILPDAVRQRRFKGTPGPFLLRWARTREAARWRSQAVSLRASAPYVRVAEIPTWVNRFLEGNDDLLKPVWNLFALELWMKAVYAA